jgi:imidazoleglycerol-phosphate dehydratase
MSPEPRKAERRAEIRRQTHETTVALELNLDGEGLADLESPVGFLNHMLALLARHSLMDLKVKALGDTDVDFHHTVEDIGICIGQALDRALATKEGIARFGCAWVPMDEALAQVAVDLSGRPFFVYNVTFPGERIGDFETQLVGEFLQAVATHGKMTLHVAVPYGSNDHHIAEAIFKGLARALKTAVARDLRVSGTPSTKGVL